MTTQAPGVFYQKRGNRQFLGSPMNPVTNDRGPLLHSNVDALSPQGEANSTFGATGGITPTFVGNGSKVEHPDLQVIFWGPFWPGGGALNQTALMNAFTSICNGPYLSGLKQYGYVGPVNIRPPMVISNPPNIALPALANGVSQSAVVYNAVYNFVSNLVNNDNIPNVDDNHEIIVMVVIDPAVPFPQNQSASGAISTVFGSHGKLEIFEFLDDNTRFAVGWVGTQAGTLGQPNQTTWTFSHELVESITNPFPNSGWVQTAPPPAANQGEIADVCNVRAEVDGVTVASYWSIADGACIIPTEDRSCFVTWSPPNPSIPHDSPTQTTYHDFGPLCASGYYDYVERTWDNTITVTTILKGYQAPAVTWTINGTPIPAPVIGPGLSFLPVPATWERAGSSALGVLRPRPRPPTILRILNNNTSLVISVGPNMGNTSFTVNATAVEAWDSVPGTQVTTSNSGSTFVDLLNQKIIWSESYQRDQHECLRRHGLHAGPLGGYQGPRDPGDPGPGGIREDVLQALRAQGVERRDLLHAAALEVFASNAELGATLEYLAEHERQ